MTLSTHRLAPAGVGTWNIEEMPTDWTDLCMGRSSRRSRRSVPSCSRCGPWRSCWRRARSMEPSSAPCRQTDQHTYRYIYYHRIQNKSIVDNKNYV